jgi:transposase-like protein
MTTDSKKSLSPSPVPQFAKSEVERALQSGLGDFTLRELLGTLVSSAGLAERQVYLEQARNDKPNGFYDRSLQVGTVPVDIRVPRTRSGEFRPASLPSPYQRGYSDEVQSLLLGLLGSSRSVNAAKDALRKWGFPSPSKKSSVWPPA